MLYKSYLHISDRSGLIYRHPFFLVDLYLFPKDGGYQFTTNGERKSLRGTISFVSGDNLHLRRLEALKLETVLH